MIPHRTWIAGLALALSGAVAFAQNPPASPPAPANPPAQHEHGHMHPMHRPTATHDHDQCDCDGECPVQTRNVTYLGVAVAPVGPALDAQIGLPRGFGLLVVQVVDNSPAQSAGVQKYDVLQKIDDQVLVNPDQLRTLIESRKPGDSVQLTVIRHGKVGQITAKLAQHQVPACPVMGHRHRPPFSPMHRMHDMHERMHRWMHHDDHDPMGEAPATGGGQSLGMEHTPPPSPSENGQQQPQRPTTQSVATATLSDAQHTLTITRTNGNETLTARDAQGNVLFNGPINTPAQRQHIPQSIRPQVDQLQQQMNTGTIRLPVPAHPHESPETQEHGPPA